MIDLSPADHNDLLHDLSVYQYILRHQDTSSLQVCTALLLKQTHAVLTCNTLKLINNIGREQRLCQEAVYTCMESFFHDLIPVKRCKDYHRSFFCITLTDLTRHIDTVHLRHLPV